MLIILVFAKHSPEMESTVTKLGSCGSRAPCWANVHTLRKRTRFDDILT